MPKWESQKQLCLEKLHCTAVVITKKSQLCNDVLRTELPIVLDLSDTTSVHDMYRLGFGKGYPSHSPLRGEGYEFKVNTDQRVLISLLLFACCFLNHFWADPPPPPEK